MTNRNGKRREHYVPRLISVLLVCCMIAVPVGCHVTDGDDASQLDPEDREDYSEQVSYLGSNGSGSGSGSNGDCYTQYGYWYCVGQCLACNTGATAGIAALAAAGVGAPGAFLALLAEGGWSAVGLLTEAELAAALGISAGALLGADFFWDWWNTCRMCYAGADPI